MMYEKIFGKKEKARAKLKIWINAQTDEGFTACHFASFKGNIVRIFIIN
jgi:hypothetical protein